jgi:hypothetical protein
MGNTISQQVTTPKSLIHCFDANGEFDTDELLLLYRHNQLRQPTLCHKVSTALVNAAVSAAEEEEASNNQTAMNNRSQRSCFRKELNVQHLDDGTIVPVVPLWSSRYLMHVSHPNIDDTKFKERFRRRFRCNYASYSTLLNLVKDCHMFDRW